MLHGKEAQTKVKYFAVYDLFYIFFNFMWFHMQRVTSVFRNVQLTIFAMSSNDFTATSAHRVICNVQNSLR